MIRFCSSLFILFILTGCGSLEERSIDDVVEVTPYADAKPGVRWWWFATEIKAEDIRYQLDWLKSKNFGAVEIAWVYPLHRYQRMYQRKYNRHYPVDTTAQEWLSPEWVKMVEFTKLYADSIGVHCDFTFGSAWPVASPDIDKALGTKIYGDSSFQQLLTFSWAWPDTFLVINHLDSNAFNAFSDPISKALKGALKGSKSSLFTDSWEIKLNSTNKIWTDGFEEKFKERFSYDIIPFMEKGLDSFPDVRYDYMLLLEELVVEGFYRPYVSKCRELGAYSRVQCLASPTDVMSTYALVDIPETESMLNNPNYSRIVSSSAALASKNIVSSESFTCMYGFPATYLREEQTADLKMVADAMFANGVNQHFYHGFPYNPSGVDSIDFFATTYFGPGGSLEKELSIFNDYIQKVSSAMRKGKTYSNVAVYLPYEDGVMKGAYPKERQRVWVWGEYELRYVDPPVELAGNHPLWINREFLDSARVKDGCLLVGELKFDALYIGVKYLDIRSLSRIYELSLQGLNVIWKGNPKQAGRIKDERFNGMIEEMLSLPNVKEGVESLHPLIEGDSLPAYWARVQDDGSILIFLAQLKSKDLLYPIYSGQSLMESSQFLELQFNYSGHTIKENIEFKPYQSVLLQISPKGNLEYRNIEYVPSTPVVRPKEKQRMYF